MFYVSLAGIDLPNYHLEWHQQGICSREKSKRSSKAYQIYLALQIIH